MKGCTAKPRADSAAHKPTVTVVLPEEVPPETRMFIRSAIARFLRDHGHFAAAQGFEKSGVFLVGEVVGGNVIRL